MTRVLSTVTRRSLVAVLVLVALAVGWWLGSADRRPAVFADDAAETVRVAPRSLRRTSAIDLRAGTVLLLEVLQGLADSNARAVYIAGGVSVNERIRIDEPLKTLSFQTASKILGGHKLYLSEDTFRGEKVYWVQRKLSRTRKRGSLLRTPPDEATGRATPPATPDTKSGAKRDARSDAKRDAKSDRNALPPPGGGDPDLRLYRRTEGKATYWLVQFETASREEAWDVMSLIEAMRKGRR